MYTNTRCRKIIWDLSRFKSDTKYSVAKERPDRLFLDVNWQGGPKTVSRINKGNKPKKTPHVEEKVNTLFEYFRNKLIELLWPTH